MRQHLFARSLLSMKPIPTESLRLGGASTVAWKSSVANAAAAAAAASTTAPELVQVPSLPFVGSLFTAYSGTPTLDHSSIFEFWPEMRRRFGDYYSFGMPGLGKGSHGTVHVIQDPHEMAKIVRQEGSFPSGAVEFAWPFEKYNEEHNVASRGLLKHGPEWKRLRSFLQTDLLSPQSAQRYLPAILEAAQYISRGAPSYSDRLNEYLNIASFDMFSYIMLGTLPRISDPTTESDPEDLLFCESVANGLRLNSTLMDSLYDGTMVRRLGFKTSLYKEFETEWETATSIARKKVEQLKEKRDKNQLSQKEADCYANQAFDRQMSDGSISMEEAKTIVSQLISAGVDTTGGMLSWKLLHIASSPHAQERIHEELSKLTAESGGKLTTETVSPSVAPYLHACMRESHRLANPVPTVPLKRMANEVEVHGVTLPAGSVILLDGYSQGCDPNLVEDPMEFRPERFLKESVQARKGTPSKVIDHVFFSGPFSQGARKCPGSRVANLEAAVLLGQLVLDWEMKTPPTIKHWTDVPYDQETFTTAKLPTVEFTARAK